MDLSQYLSQLDGSYRLYDVGRRIRKLDKSQFKQFENAQSPYPFPYLQHAWLALYISPKGQSHNETLFFLKWPLDEQGQIIPYVRDDLVHRLIQLSNIPEVTDTEIEDPLKDNPFAFKPDDIRRANIHAMVQASQNRKPSEHLDGVISYLQSGALNKEHLNNWQHLGMQGIADLAARQQDYEASLIACLPFMPAEVYLAFSQCLEHHTTPHKLADVISKRFESDLKNEKQSSAIEASLRILGACHSDELRLNTWLTWMASDYKEDIACVLAFSTRNYDDLAFMPDKITDFLLTLAYLNQASETESDAQARFAVFIKIVGDLLFLPGIRTLLLSCLRDTERPEILSQALQALLNSKQGS